MLAYTALAVIPGLKAIHIDSSSGPPLAPDLVKALCTTALPALPGLRSLHLTGASCRQHGLLTGSSGGGLAGGLLQFLPQLTSLELSEADEEVVKSVNRFCPALLNLALYHSKVGVLITQTFVLKSRSFEMVD